MDESKVTLEQEEDLNGVKYLFVGEQPYMIDVRNNNIHSSRGVQLLDIVLKSLGLDKTSCYTVLSLKKNSDGKPLTKEDYMQCFNSRLEKKLKGSDIDVIVPLGKKAIQYFLPDIDIGDARKQDKITKVRNRFYHSYKYNCKIQPIYSPVYVLNRPNAFKQWVKDIEKIPKIKDYPKPEELETEVKVADTVEYALKAIKFLETQDLLSTDIETSGFNYYSKRIGVISFSWKEGKSLVIGEPIIHDHKVIEALTRLFNNESVKFLWQNGKFDIKFIRSKFPGCNARVDEDSLLMHYVLDEERGHGLKQLAPFYLNVGDYDAELKDYIKAGDEDANYLDVPKDILHKYGGMDTDYTLRIFNILKEQMDEHDEKVYYDIMIPATNALAQVEMNGLKVDIPYLKKLDIEYTAKLTEMEDDLQKYAILAGFTPEHYMTTMGAKSCQDGVFNPGSYQQVNYMCLELLGLPKHDNRVSADSEARDYWLRELGKPEKWWDDYKEGDLKEWLQDSVANRFVHTLAEYKVTKKQHSTYIRAFLKNTWDDGRVHTTFLQFGTKTGRLSSKSPNIQNLPRDKRIKDAFIPDEGKVLLEIDYSRLRGLAIEKLF